MSDNSTNIVIAGDSIGRGQVTSSNNWADLSIPGSYSVENMSLNGTTVRDQSTMFEEDILSNYNANDKSNWLIIQAGTNDLGQGTSAFDLYRQVESFTNDAHAAGFKVLVATVLPRNGSVFSWTDSDENNRTTYNQLVRSNSIGADAVADIASDSVMGQLSSTNNLTLYIDGLHPSANAVKSYLEPIYSSAIAAVENEASSSESQKTSPAADTGPTVPVQSPAPPSTVPSSDSSSFPPATVPPIGSTATIGSGSDQLLLHLSENAYEGDAQFTVSVDGQQVGGVQTVHTERGSGSDSLLIQGNWAAGTHDFSIDFINDLFGGSASADRNLYLQDATYNGNAIGNAHYDMIAGGAVAFMFQDGNVTAASSVGSAAVPSSTATTPAAPAQTTAPTSEDAKLGAESVSASGRIPTSSLAATIGSGPDQLLLHLSENAYQGDARYTVSVDGQQIGGVQTAHTARGQGTDDLLVQGNWAAGSHEFDVSFVNDLNGGSPSADRNLYVDSGTYNGANIGNAHYDLMAGGTVGFKF